MATVHDIAAYILAKQGPMSTWKLQKLVYYAQAWHLVWDEERLFRNRIEAWANGPVVRDLYKQHRGMFTIRQLVDGSPAALTKDERETVDAVLGGYGELTGRQLSLLTHAEYPWQEAREGLAPTDRSEREITPEMLHAYYTWLDSNEDALGLSEIDWDTLED